MKYLVDANVLSEATKLEPDRKVLQWLLQHEAEFAIDSIIRGEVLFGVLKLPPSRKRRHLEQWYNDGVSRITCLPWTATTSECWAWLLFRLRKAGLNTPIADTMIAATALAHDLTVVTRNERDFSSCGVRIVNPFAR